MFKIYFVPILFSIIFYSTHCIMELLNSVICKERALEYFKKCVSKIPYSEFEELLPKHLKETVSYYESKLKLHKYHSTPKNLAETISEDIVEADWGVKEILHKAVFLELEFIARYSDKFRWKVHSLQSLDPNETAESFGVSLRKTIQKKQQDADISQLNLDGLLWYAVIYKRPQMLGVYETPIFFTMTSDLSYLFTKAVLPQGLIQAISETLRCHSIETLRLEGEDVPSLVRLLRGSQRSEFNQPEILSPMETDDGVDYTQQNYVEECIKKYLDADVKVPLYKVESAQKKWVGDDAPELSLLDMKTEVEFCGDVTEILAQCMRTKMCEPPYPDYIKNFMTLENVMMKNKES